MGIWVPKAILAVANDIYTATLLGDPASQSNAALSAAVAPLVATEIAADPTIAAAGATAAVNAVNGAIASTDLIKRSESAAPWAIGPLADGSQSVTVNLARQAVAKVSSAGVSSRIGQIALPNGGGFVYVPGKGHGGIDSVSKRISDTFTYRGVRPDSVLFRERARMGLNPNTAPTWCVHPERFDAARSLYNAKPTNTQNWGAAYARAAIGGAFASIIIPGTSITAGAGSSPGTAKVLNAYPSRVREALAKAIGYNAGTGWVPMFNIIWSSATGLEDSRVTYGTSATQAAGTGGTTTTNAGFMGLGAAHLINDTGNGWVQFASDKIASTMSVSASALAGSTGLATVKIDGVSAGTFDVSAAGGSGTLTRRAGYAANVIVIDIPVSTAANTAAGGSVTIGTGGVLTTATAHGLFVGQQVQLATASTATGIAALTTYYIIAVGSSTTLTLSTQISGTALTTTTGTATGLTSLTHVIRVEGPTSGSPVDINAFNASTGQGVQVTNSGRSSSRIDEQILDDPNNRYGMPIHFDMVRPNLVLLDIGINNRNDASSAVFTAKVRTEVARIRSLNSDVAVIVMAQPDYTDATVGSTSFVPRMTDLYALADELDFPLIDISWAFGLFPGANGRGLFNDGIHPSNTGLMLICHLVTQFLTTVA
jgi:lysophospholipase L1-like esterase